MFEKKGACALDQCESRHRIDGRTPIHTWLCCALALLLLLASGTSRALAQTPAPPTTELQMRVGVGLGDRFRPGFWTPITVHLANDGLPIDGTLSFTVRHGNPFQAPPFTTTYQEPVHLAQGARQVVQVSLLLRETSQPLRVELEGPAGEVLLSQAIDLRTHQTGAHLVVALAPEGHGWGWLQQQLGSAFTLRGQRIGLEVVYVREASELPRDWAGYHGVTAVAISGGFPLQALTPQQQSALRTWVEAGGSLMMAGGPRTEAARSEIAADLSPLTLSGGLRTVEAWHEANRSAASPERLVAWATAPRAGSDVVARASDGAPLVARRTMGAGEVLLITFDPNAPELASWGGLGDLARDALRSAQTVGTALPPSFEQAAWTSIEAGRIAHVGRFLPALFIAGYAVCVGLILRAARRRKSWLLAACIVVGVSVGTATWWIGPQAQTAQRGVHEIEVTLAGRNGAATSWSYLGLVSLPESPWLGESAETTFARSPSLDLFGSQTGPDVTLTSEGDRVVITGLAEGEFERFRQAALEHFPLWADLSTVGFEYRLTVVNETDRHLESVYYVGDGQHLYLGEIAPGETRQASLPGRRQTAGQATPEWVGNALAGDVRGRAGGGFSRVGALLGSLVTGYLSTGAQIPGSSAAPSGFLVGVVRSAPKTTFEPRPVHERIHLFLGTLNSRPAEPSI